MGTTLTGTTPQDTYDSLIKVTDNGPISGTLKALSDGLGNDSTLSLSTTAASIAGTLAVSGDFSIADKIVHIGDTNTAIRFPAADTITFETSGAEAARITSTGLVGIGKTNPSNPLHILKAESSVLLGGLKVDRDPNTTSSAIFNAYGGAAWVVSNSGATSSFLPILFALSDNTTTTEIARITSDGLTFNGDSAAANALDDYEEGTWTMGVTFGGASVGVTYGGNAGTYTKIGRQVTVNGYLYLTSKGSSTGDAKITGLPFSVANTTGSYSPPSLFFDKITFANQFQGYGVVGTTTIILAETTVLGATTSLTNADFSNTSEVMVSFTYFV